MISKKLDTADIGGDLTNNVEALMAQAALANRGTMLNKDLLPSKGHFYSNDIFVKQLSAQDIKNLSMLTEDNVNNVINSVLGRCVSGIDYNDILVGDKLWFIFYLRFISYDPAKFPYRISYTCPECKSIDEIEFTLDDVKVNYYKDDFKDSIELPNGDIVDVTYPTIGNEKKAIQMKKNDQFGLDGEFLDLAGYIKGVNGKEFSIRQAYEYITSMSAECFSEFMNTMADYAIGIVPYIDIQCKCGETINKRINFTADFFMPKKKK